ncbi:MAG: hypothetical protein U0802_13600 [Candidatus Binatia bacterium]
MSVLEGSRPTRRVRVAGTVDELIGFNAYMDRAALHRLMREDGALSGAFLTVDQGQAPRSTASSSACRRWPASPSARWR